MTCAYVSISKPFCFCKPNSSNSTSMLRKHCHAVLFLNSIAYVEKRFGDHRLSLLCKVRMSPFRYQLVIKNLEYISRSASDRSPLIFRRNRSLYLLYRPLKLSQRTKCTILMYLGQRDCPPSTFGLFANGAANLLRPCPAAEGLVT